MIPEECKTMKSDSKIVLSENKSKICFHNKKGRNICVVKVDGCAITAGERCDHLLITEESTEHFIELKGHDIKKAITQIENTIRILSAQVRNKTKFSYIISTRCPLHTPEIQKYQSQFKKKYNSHLLIKNIYGEYYL